MNYSEFIPLIPRQQSRRTILINNLNKKCDLNKSIILHTWYKNTLISIKPDYFYDKYNNAIWIYINTLKNVNDENDFYTYTKPNYDEYMKLTQLYNLNTNYNMQPNKLILNPYIN